jgi:hypothetical protein
MNRDQGRSATNVESTASEVRVNVCVHCFTLSPTVEYVQFPRMAMRQVPCQQQKLSKLIINYIFGVSFSFIPIF